MENLTKLLWANLDIQTNRWWVFHRTLTHFGSQQDNACQNIPRNFKLNQWQLNFNQYFRLKLWMRYSKQNWMWHSWKCLCSRNPSKIHNSILNARRATFQPVNFEVHCCTCRQLEIKSRLKYFQDHGNFKANLKQLIFNQKQGLFQDCMLIRVSLI